MKELVYLTGLTGQLGSHMAEKLLNEGHKVIGLVRRSSAPNYWRIESILNHPGLMILEGDATDYSFISKTISRYKPDWFINYCCQSHVHTSFEQPQVTWQVAAEAVVHMLESIKQFSPHTKFISSNTSEMFGSCYDEDEKGKYQDENTLMVGNSPYAIGKLCAHQSIKLYRECYNLWASSIIMFNAESEKRGELFVTRKISTYVAKLNKAIKDGIKLPKLKLGNLDSCRDWGYVSNYIEAYILSLKQDKPDDFVICTEETHSIREFLDEAFNLIGINDWSGYVEVDETLKRPSEVPYLCGRHAKAKKVLGWEPKVKFKELVKIMVLSDIERLK